MIEIRKTEIFTKWFDGLKDRRAKARIQARIDRIEMGNFGDVAPVGEGISEFASFTAPATGYISYSKARLSSYFCPAVIKIPRMQTSDELKNLPSR